ncbi:MAG: hypothetical protein ABI580_02785 [Burkholderiaceae bacterium]
MRALLGVLSGSIPKSSASGDSVAAGAVGVGAVPVPVRPTLCGLPDAVDVTVTAPEYVVALLGAKLTLIVQVRPAPSVAGQLCGDAKPLPDGTIDVIASPALPELVSVIDFAAVVMFTV